MKILIRLPNWLGDVVMSTAFVAAVREFYPGAAVDVIIKKELSGIASLIPGLNTVHPFSKQEHKGLKGAYHFGKQLRAEKYDLFLTCQLRYRHLYWVGQRALKSVLGLQKRVDFFC